MMAHLTTIHGNQAQFPELSALRTQHQELLTKSTETRQMLEALCQVLIKAGVVSEQGFRPRFTDSLWQQFGKRTHVPGACLYGASFAAAVWH